MAWVELVGATNEVAIHPNGKIHWNSAAHMMLSSPMSVEVFHDAATNRLGLRRIHRNTQCLEVFFDGDDYTIASQQHLANAGISVAEIYTAVLHEPTPPSVGNLGDMGIWWIDLP